MAVNIINNVPDPRKIKSEIVLLVANSEGITDNPSLNKQKTGPKQGMRSVNPTKVKGKN